MAGGRSGRRDYEEEERVFLREYLQRLPEFLRVEAAGVASNIHVNNRSTNTKELNVDGVKPPPGNGS